MTTLADPTPDTFAALGGIHHVGLTVTDAEASASWYERVLGLRRLFVEPHHGSDCTGYAIVLATLDGGLHLGLEHHPSHRGERFDPTRTGLDHLCLPVPTLGDLDRWTAHLDALGIASAGPYPMSGTPMWFLTFRDPDGIQLELVAVVP